MVKQRKLEQGWYKCNSYGTSKGNSGTSSVAYCMRNKEGDFIYASCKQMQDTSIYAQALIMMEGYFYCVEHQFLSLALETDSLALDNIAKGEQKVPWRTGGII